MNQDHTFEGSDGAVEVTLLGFSSSVLTITYGSGAGLGLAIGTAVGERTEDVCIWRADQGPLRSRRLLARNPTTG